MLEPMLANIFIPQEVKRTLAREFDFLLYDRITEDNYFVHREEQKIYKLNTAYVGAHLSKVGIYETFLKKALENYKEVKK